ncbi:hypothetical protein [Herbaspirillum frisingense]|uniref:hypothetical protein n=1 Tax=Herbaspirillum frisingense TaxID=92645 RepID=UPI0039B05E92
MPSEYLQGDDIAAYGATGASAAQIKQASVLLDAYLQRPAGMVYVNDASGQPGYMQALNTELSFTAGQAFGPGMAVTVPTSGPLSMLQVGDCVLIDRENPDSTEAAQVTSIDTTAGTMTLGSTAGGGLQFQHASGALLETGYFITEKRYLPKSRSEVILGNAPVARVVGGTGRYGYGRRADAANYDMAEFNLLASLNKFGGPPAWEIWPANTAAGIDAATGQLWVPAGVMLAYYTEVRVRYVAGYLYSALPAVIKEACAMAISAMTNMPALGNVKSYAAGDTKIVLFASTFLSDDIKQMINPWRARPFA